MEKNKGVTLFIVVLPITLSFYACTAERGLVHPDPLPTTSQASAALGQPDSLCAIGPMRISTWRNKPMVGVVQVTLSFGEREMLHRFTDEASGKTLTLMRMSNNMMHIHEEALRNPILELHPDFVYIYRYLKRVNIPAEEGSAEQLICIEKE